MRADDHRLAHGDLSKAFPQEFRLQPARGNQEGEHLDVLRPASLALRGSHVVRLQAKHPLDSRERDQAVLPAVRELLEGDGADDIGIVAEMGVERATLPECKMEQFPDLFYEWSGDQIGVKCSRQWPAPIIPEFGE